MGKMMYAIVGNFGFDTAPKGVTVFRYEPLEGRFDLLGTFLEHINVGRQCYDIKKKVLYLVDERARDRSGFGGGGYVLAVKIDWETGIPTVLNEKETLAPKPAFVSLDGRSEYALVAHHVNHDRVVRIGRDDWEHFISETLCDDTPVVLFPLEEEGRLGVLADAMVFKGNQSNTLHGISHQHSITPDPTGEFFLVCDKGLDELICLKIDRQEGKLKLMHRETVPDGSAPRYCAYHPYLPILYVDYELKPNIVSYRYDRERGNMEFLLTESVLLPESEREWDGKDEIAPCDILIHPSGRHLYVSIRGTDTLALFRIDDAGRPTLMRNIVCGGSNPRGLSLSPDGRFLFVMNIASGTVNGFALGETGDVLKNLGVRAKSPKPGNMIIISLEGEGANK